VVNQGVTPTIAHVPTGIVHERQPGDPVIEKLPSLRNVTRRKFKRRNG
jgi:hypothetical protein